MVQLDTSNMLPQSQCQGITGASQIHPHLLRFCYGLEPLCHDRQHAQRLEAHRLLWGVACKLEQRCRGRWGGVYMQQIICSAAVLIGQNSACMRCMSPCTFTTCQGCRPPANSCSQPLRISSLGSAFADPTNSAPVVLPLLSNPQVGSLPLATSAGMELRKVKPLLTNRELSALHSSES